MQTLFDRLDAKLFKSNHFFMLELNRCADTMPPKWASYFDKMKGIIREPGRLIVKTPPQDTRFASTSTIRKCTPISTIY